MHPRLRLFVIASKSFAQSKLSSTRKLYTDPIYPYPFKYMNTKKHPSMPRYRENWMEPWWTKKEDLAGLWGFRLFWTYWWYMLFKYPHYLFGHEKIPDPLEWSDEELGIPADDVGLYQDWLEAKLQESQ